MQRLPLRGLDPSGASDGDVAVFDAASGLWIAAAPTSGSVATDPIFDAKGDLAVGTAADAASRLAVGSNGQVLTADSSTVTGLKWATASGGGGIAFTGCKAVRSTTQTLTHATPAAISFTDADEYDTNAIHDTATNPTRLTIPVGMGGQWRCSAQAQIQQNAAGGFLVEMAVRKNGTGIPSYIIGDRRQTATNSVGFGGFSQPITVAAGDYLELWMEQSSGSNKTVQASFSIERLS